MTEIVQLASEAKHSQEISRHLEARTAIHAGSLAIDDKFADAVRNFYQGDFADVVRMDGHILPSGEIRRTPANAGSLYVVDRDGESQHIAMGNNDEDIRQGALEAMRTLETVETQPLVRIQIRKGVAANFTALEYYAPKIAPGSPAYPIPEYVAGLQGEDLEDNPNRSTYVKTKEITGWQEQVFSLVKDYVHTNSEGQKMLEALRIQSLDSLTPEQAAKLSVWFVQSVSRYTNEDVTGEPGKTAADQSTAMQLLAEGIEHKGDSGWKGNGVCRNVASNVQIVFESLKENQGDLSMLNNTYCRYVNGHDGDGYSYSRVETDFSTTTLTPEPRGGHAWNEFVTVDATSSTSITIVDATWGLVTPDHLQDYTALRSSRLISELYERCEDKKDAFYDVGAHLARLMNHAYGVGRGREEKQQIQEYAFTEYLRVVQEALPLFRETEEPIYVERSVFNVGYRLGERLTDSELDTLFALTKEEESDPDIERLFASILKKNVASEKRAKETHHVQLERRFLKKDDEYQGMIFDALGNEAVVALSKHSGKIRARLRELRPETLPPFDPENSKADKQELRELAASHDIRAFRPADIRKEVERHIQKLAGDEAVYAAIIEGRDTYNLVKNFGAIQAALKKRSVLDK